MSGLIEHIQEEVNALRAVLVKLCAKSGHEDEVEQYSHCDARGDEQRTFHAVDDDYLEVRHATRCAICGEYACERSEA